MLIPGGAAFTETQAKHFVASCREISTKIIAVRASLVHCVSYGQYELTPPQIEKLVSILHYTPADHRSFEPNKTYCVLPKLMQPTEWGRQMCELFQQVGLGIIHRIERGLLYQFQIEGALTSEEELQLNHLIQPMSGLLCFESAEAAHQAFTEGLTMPRNEEHFSQVDVLGVYERQLPHPPEELLAPFEHALSPVHTDDINIWILALLSHVEIASRAFFYDHVPRTIGGRKAFDVCLGPWQVPIGQASLRMRSMNTRKGYAEVSLTRQQSSNTNPLLLVSEALLKIAFARPEHLSDIRMSVKAHLSAEQHKELLAFTSRLGVPCQVQNLTSSQESMEVLANAPIADVRLRMNGRLRLNQGETVLLWIRVSSPYAADSLYHQMRGDTEPDTMAIPPQEIKSMLALVELLREQDLIMAQQVCGRGGLLMTLCHMMFASRVGIELECDALGDNLHDILFGEKPGLVIQVSQMELDEILSMSASLGVDCDEIGTLNEEEDSLEIFYEGEEVLNAERAALEHTWTRMSLLLKSQYIPRALVDDERDLIDRSMNQSMGTAVGFDVQKNLVKHLKESDNKPKVLCLYRYEPSETDEAVGAFESVGFECVVADCDAILADPQLLTTVRGLCVSGFNNEQATLSPGLAWGYRILMDATLKQAFTAFFKRADTFALGTGAGCHLLSALRDLIPGAALWPHFEHNDSGLFEARFVVVELPKSMERSCFFDSAMLGSLLPTVVFYRCGKGVYRQADVAMGHIACRYVDEKGQATERYPFNPAGSALGSCGFLANEGRVFATMMHPEYVYRAIQLPWAPREWGVRSPWRRMFANLRLWVEKS